MKNEDGRIEEIELLQAEITGLKRQINSNLQKLGKEVSNWGNFLTLLPDTVCSEKLHQLYKQATSIQTRRKTSRDQLDRMKELRIKIIDLEDRQEEKVKRLKKINNMLESHFVPVGKSAVKHLKKEENHSEPVEALLEKWNSFTENHEQEKELQLNNEKTGGRLPDHLKRIAENLLPWNNNPENRKQNLLRKIGKAVLENEQESNSNLDELERDLTRARELVSRKQTLTEKIEKLDRALEDKHREMEATVQRSQKVEKEVAKLAREIGILEENLNELLRPLGESAYRAICRCSEMEYDNHVTDVRGTELWSSIQNIHQYRMEINHREKHMQLLKAKMNRDHLTGRIARINNQREKLKTEIDRLQQLKRNLSSTKGNLEQLLKDTENDIDHLSEILTPPYKELQKEIPSLEIASSNSSREILPNRIHSEELQEEEEQETSTENV